MKNLGAILAGFVVVYLATKASSGSTNNNPTGETTGAGNNSTNSNSGGNTQNNNTNTNTANSTATDSFPLKVGSVGKNVERLQKALIEAGYKIDKDGVFGTQQTLPAVRKYFSNPQMTQVQEWNLAEIEYDNSIRSGQVNPNSNNSSDTGKYYGFSKGDKIYSKGDNTFNIAYPTGRIHLFSSALEAGAYPNWNSVKTGNTFDSLSFNGGQLLGQFTGLVGTAGSMLVIITSDTPFSTWRLSPITPMFHGLWVKPDKAVK